MNVAEIGARNIRTLDHADEAAMNVIVDNR
jgi:hypothetical protein